MTLCKQQLHNLLIAILITVMLSGCGFKLQGKYTFPDYMQNIIIAGSDNYGYFSILLKDYLKTNGINIVTDDQINSDKVVKLEINSPKITEQINSYDSKGQIRQYRLVATLHYKLLDYQGRTLKQNVINRSRTYSWAPNKVLSSFNEQQIINEELNIEIINELFRQLVKINNLSAQDNKSNVTKSPC